jgi:hypothetical protein
MKDEETAMKRFGEFLALAALGAAVVASGPALAFGGGHGGGGGFGGGHMGGGGGHMMGMGGGGHMMGMGGGPRMGMGGFNRGMFVGRSVATPGFNRGFDHRFAHFDHFHHFHHFRNRFGFFPFYGGVWDYGYADCGYWGNWGNPYCGYGYSNYAYSYPEYGYDTSYYGNGYDNSYADDYGYPATGSSGYYAAAPLVTGRSVATGQLGSYCTISVRACELQHPSYVGGACSCRVPGGHARGLVTR